MGNSFARAERAMLVGRSPVDLVFAHTCCCSRTVLLNVVGRVVRCFFCIIPQSGEHDRHTTQIYDICTSVTQEYKTHFYNHMFRTFQNDYITQHKCPISYAYTYIHNTHTIAIHLHLQYTQFTLVLTGT